MKKIKISVLLVVAVMFLSSIFTANVFATEGSSASIDNETVIYVQQGESYLFQNVTATYANIKWPRTGTYQVKDYVSYKSDGTTTTMWEADSDSKVVGGGIITNPNGFVVVTGVSEEPVELRYDPNVFTVSTSENPALFRIKIVQGESYSLTNHSNIGYTMVKWKVNVGEMSYSEYRGNGTLYHSYTTSLSVSPWGYNVGPGCTIVFDVIRCDNPVEIVCPYLIFAPLN